LSKLTDAWWFGWAVSLQEVNLQQFHIEFFRRSLLNPVWKN